MMNDRYLDPTNDVAFKRVFENKTRLMSFLNSILRLEGDSQIINLNFMSPEEVPDFGIGKKAVFDLQVSDARGKRYVIEMQNRKEDHFLQRMQFYASTAYTNQARRGVLHDALVPVILIAITKNKIFSDDIECVSYHATLETKTKQQHLFAVSYVFVELPKFDKKEDELSGPCDEWLYFLSKSIDSRKPPITVSEKAVLDAFDNIEKFNWTEGQYDAYVRARLSYEVELLAMNKSYDEGKEEGREEGSLQKAKEIAIQSLRAGIEISIISNITGLSKEDIEKLK